MSSATTVRRLYALNCFPRCSLRFGRLETAGTGLQRRDCRLTERVKPARDAVRLDLRTWAAQLTRMASYGPGHRQIRT